MIKASQFAAWEAIGDAYFLASSVWGPGPSQVERYLAQVESGTTVTVLGASTLAVIDAAARRGCDVQVLDFSPNMIASMQRQLDAPLRGAVQAHRCDLSDADLELPSDVRPAQVVVADRLYNRMDVPGRAVLLGWVRRLLAPVGEARMSLRFGWYPRDRALMARCEELGLAPPYSVADLWIDYHLFDRQCWSSISEVAQMSADRVRHFLRLRGREWRLRPLPHGAADLVAVATLEGLIVRDLPMFGDGGDRLAVLSPASEGWTR